MIITEKEVLHLIENYPEEEIAFKFFYADSPTGLTPMETYIKKGFARFKERPFDKLSAHELILNDLKSIAYFMDSTGEKIAERENEDAPMIAIKEHYFKQDAFSQRIEDELLAEKTGREVFLPEMSHEEAGALMKGFAQYYKNLK